MKVLSFTEDADSVKSILQEVKELEKQLKQVEVEVDKANLKANDEKKTIDIDSILEGIGSLKGDSFRKKDAKL